MAASARTLGFRAGPYDMLGGEDGALNDVEVCAGGCTLIPAYGSKGEGFELGAGDRVQVRTPGGGGYDDPRTRPRALTEPDLRYGYFDEHAARVFESSSEGRNP